MSLYDDVHREAMRDYRDNPGDDDRPTLAEATRDEADDEPESDAENAEVALDEEDDECPLCSARTGIVCSWHFL